MNIKTIFFLIAGIATSLASLFFAYYTFRLVYVNLFVPETAEHRSTGMLIGAVVFPIATIAFGMAGWLSFRFMRSAKKR